MRTAATFLLVLLCAGLASAQKTLRLNEPVEFDLAPEASRSYTIQLNLGDYVAGSLDQRGATADIEVFLPDSLQLRSFPRTQSERKFAFVAESFGAYRIEIKNQDKTQTGKCKLRLTTILSLDERMKPAPPRDKYTNSKIEALRKQIANGQTKTEAFWRGVAEEGTPLAENAGNDEAHELVTFLWRGDQNTRNVLVDFYPFAAAHTEDYSMRRLAKSDVWYVTVKLPKGARFVYTLSPNDPLTFERPRAEQREATTQADPLNPNRWACAQGASKFDCMSRVELPGAVPQPWLIPNQATRTGKIDKHRIKSEILKNERNLSVYTPAGYRADGSPPALLVIFDESSYLTWVPTPVILDNLIAASKIPPMIAVLIANPSRAARNKELPPNPDFADFLAKELIPWTHAHYNVTNDPRQSVVAGSSYGGLAATYAGLRHSEVFGNVLCQSGSFWWAPGRDPSKGIESSQEGGWLAKQFIQSPKLPLKFYLDAGWFEDDLTGDGAGILEPTRHMRDVLLARGYEVHYQESVGGHDYLSWRGTLADGLVALLGK